MAGRVNIPSFDLPDAGLTIPAVGSGVGTPAGVGEPIWVETIPAVVRTDFSFWEFSEYGSQIANLLEVGRVSGG